MRPPGDSTGGGRFDGKHLKSRNELNEEPIAKKQDGRNLHRPKNNEEWDESGDARSGIANEICAQHSGNGAAGANGGNTRLRGDDDLDESSRNPGDQVEEKEREMSEAIFNAASEYKEKEHVPEQMEPPSVEKHGDENGRYRESCRERK